MWCFLLYTQTLHIIYITLLSMMMMWGSTLIYTVFCTLGVCRVTRGHIILETSVLREEGGGGVGEGSRATCVETSGVRSIIVHSMYGAFTCLSKWLWLCRLPVASWWILQTGVRPSLVLGSDINQKSVFHYSVIGVSVLYVLPIMCVSCEAVEPPVSNHLIPIWKSCHMTGQKDSCIIYPEWKVLFWCPLLQ